jgi:hypothetical protein
LRKNNCLSLFLVFCFTIQAIHSASYIVVTHGSRGARSQWYKPSLDGTTNFYQELEAQAHKRNVDYVEPFTWSGSSGFPLSSEKSVKAHVQAAEELANLFLSLYPDRPDTYIGHSNGGVVGLLASHMLWNPHHHAGKNPPRLFDHQDVKQTSADVWARKYIQEKVLARQRQFTAQDPQIKIPYLIMIATPQNKYLYTANMDTVGCVIALHSQADKIQKTFSLSRIYSPGRNVLNLRVTTELSNGGRVYPLHTGFMTPFIAREILNLMPRAMSVLSLDKNELGSVLAVDVLINEDPEKSLEFKRVYDLNVLGFKASGNGL